MKTLVLVVLLLSTGSAMAQYRTQSLGGFGYGTGSNPNNHAVERYTRRDGVMVQPHYQTNPNNTQRDNYGTLGNQNPYTGTYGTRRPRW